MAHETDPQEVTQTRLTAIYIDLERKAIVMAGAEGVVASVRLAPEGVIFEAASAAVPIHPVSEIPATVAPETATTESSEREKPLTLQGKLKSKPREGRPDGRGNPTAWARFAAHEEGQEGAHMYSTTFHRHTAEIALGLDKDMPLTVQGFAHVQDDPGSKRMDTLSVINLLDYPGKGKK